MPEILQYGFMVRALAAGVVVAVICPLIGVFLVLRRLSLIADTLSHVALAGVALGLLTGASPVLGALAVALAGAVGVERLRASGRLFGESALAVFLSGGFALAAVLLSLARGFTVDLFAFLFGSITTVEPGDLWVIGGLGVVVAAAVGLLYRDLFAITFDEEAARVAGLPVSGLNLLLAVLTALVVVVSMRIVGVLLVSAMIVIPTITSQQLARSFRQTLWLGVAFGVAAVVLGLVAAYYLDLAAGGAIVLVSLGLFAGTAWLRRSR